MSGEIKSAADIAQSHVDAVNTANTEFGTAGEAPEAGLQMNQPTEAMRAAFANADAACGNLSSYLGRDVEKIALMAEEFELWDQQTGSQNE